ncbi:MAG: two-component sensor histidine kinase, partial [Clostridia bacterium]|nr:two-component sensor histidine kinase [Clostridia bacterium]
MRRKIMINYVQVLTAAIVLTIVLMTLMTYNMFEERMVDDLRVDARVLATIAGTERAEQIFSELEKELRVTIVAPSGAVIYDNRMEAIRMDSHADRPEIVSAMTHGEGRDIRDSKTLDRSTFYYAMRLESGFVLRVAKESTSIWSVYARAVPLILVLMLAMLAVCALIAERLTRKLLEPV